MQIRDFRYSGMGLSSKNNGAYMVSVLNHPFQWCNPYFHRSSIFHDMTLFYVRFFNRNYRGDVRL